MQDPDPKCRHFGILLHFGIFAKKSNRKSNPILYVPIIPVLEIDYRGYRGRRTKDIREDQKAGVPENLIA